MFREEEAETWVNVVSRVHLASRTIFPRKINYFLHLISHARTFFSTSFCLFIDETQLWSLVSVNKTLLGQLQSVNFYDDPGLKMSWGEINLIKKKNKCEYARMLEPISWPMSNCRFEIWECLRDFKSDM